jgi:hypothetical protein
MRIPRIEDYYTPQDQEAAEAAGIANAVGKRGPVASIGRNRTVIDTGAAAGIVMDIIAAKKAAKAGAPAQARYQSEKWAYEQELSERKMQEMAEDRRIDNERMASRNKALEDASARDAEMRRENYRSMDEARRASDSDRDAMRQSLEQYRNEMMGFRGGEMGLSKERAAESARHNREIERLSGQRLEAGSTKNPKDEVLSGAMQLERTLRGQGKPEDYIAQQVNAFRARSSRMAGALPDQRQAATAAAPPAAPKAAQPKAAPPAAPAAEQVFVNPQTGERIVKRDGKWVPATR